MVILREACPTHRTCVITLSPYESFNIIFLSNSIQLSSSIKIEEFESKSPTKLISFDLKWELKI